VTDRETLRLAPPVIFWWVWVAFVAVNVVDYAVQGLPSARFGATIVPGAFVGDPLLFLGKGGVFGESGDRIGQQILQPPALAVAIGAPKS